MPSDSDCMMTPLESLKMAPAAVAGPLLVVNLTVNLTHDDDAAVCHTGSRPAGCLLGPGASHQGGCPSHCSLRVAESVPVTPLSAWPGGQGPGPDLDAPQSESATVTLTALAPLLPVSSLFQVLVSTKLLAFATFTSVKCFDSEPRSRTMTLTQRGPAPRPCRLHCDCPALAPAAELNAALDSGRP
jgi:hypothetical protein